MLPQFSQGSLDPLQTAEDFLLRVVMQVPVLDQHDEDARDFVGGKRSFGLVPLIEPIAHPQQREREELRWKRRQPLGLDALADYAFN